ncbi:rho GTPase-activating protein 21 isoform X2 [Thalassophryne amazonica]|uniref:rho GTPase-activating protein 21 isoform X2 n=1 Tax=Thalassophryne amazonica TaxID=390379 RepID=UPI0014725EA5|nr:rho GTPase-activating protein 21 isoform X2 [Thalassophryne amazonica]
MMASQWIPSFEENERQPARTSFCENDSSEWRNLFESPAAQYSTEDESFSWPRPKTVRLRRTSQGFGFTLRHFIVYPPESTMHDSLRDDDHSRRGRQRNRLEPMDTIFVKQVKEGGPAHGAGLCTGDRIVKVNGASIIGKAYCEVISLIQDSGDFLELCVMPKDEDILQLAYSQDAYLRSHNTYSGNACHIPEPPPVCYPRVDCKPVGMAQATDQTGLVCRGSLALPEHGYRKEVPMPPSFPHRQYPKSQIAVCMRNDNVRTVVVPPDTSHIGRVGPAHRMDCVDPVFIRGRPGSVAQYPQSRKADFHPSSAGMVVYGSQASHYPTDHQNIDWRTYQTYREYIDNKGIHSHGSRTIQERLDSLRAANQNTFSTSPHILRADWGAKVVRRRSTSHDRSYHGPPPHFQIAPRSASQDRLLGTERVSQARNWPPRSTSQGGLMQKSRAHSVDYVETVEVAQPIQRRGGYGRSDQCTRPSRQSMPRQAVLCRPTIAYRSGIKGAPNLSLYPKEPDSVQTRSSPMLSERPSHFGKNTNVEHPVADQRTVVKSQNARHTIQQGPSRVRAEAIQPAEVGRNAALVGLRSSSCSTPKQKPQRPSILKPPQLDSLSHTNGRSPTETGVVLREKSHSGKNTSPLRHPSYILAVNDGGADVVACWLPNDARREIHMRRLEEQHHTSCSSNLDESLDSIPFIDEPASPSVDHQAAPIPASAVISAPPSTITGPTTPISPGPPIRRQLSHDQESLRNALLESESPIKTERSKSYDEGLDNYQEEGRARSSSRHMSGFRGGLRKALDGHKFTGDSDSRRDSASDIFDNSTKEGFLNFRQLSTDKNKRVSGGMKSWKQMYAVLQGNTLTLYKDRKDGLTHASLLSDEEPLQISIKACLIDISYSDTRRKNVLRLTTSDCEYLFQAEGRDDMLSWIRVIQENSNPDEENSNITSQDLISRKIKEYTMMSAPTSRSEPSPKTSRQALSIKQAILGGRTDARIHNPHSPKTGDLRRALKDDSSPPRDRTAWKIGITGIMRKQKPPAGVTFGVRLDDCPPAQSNRFVPLIVEVCCKVVEERGLEYTGIYRVPGNNAAISSMQEELNSKGMTDIDIQEDKWRDLNVISSLLKSFFRKLPEPLFTNEKYADFIEANRTEDSVEKLKELKRLIHELPDYHYETLKFLCAHLKKVSDNCETNKMEPRNLAIVFGPTLVRTSEDNMTNMVNHMPDQCKIVENLIQQYDWFFTDDVDEDPATAAEQENTVQSQPVPNIDHLLSNIGRTALSPGDVSDSSCGDSSKSKGLWGSGKDQCSKEMLRSSFFVSRKRKKPKDKTLPSSSDDDLDSVFLKKELPEESQQQPLWSPDSRTEEEGETDETGKETRQNGSEEQLSKRNDKESLPVMSESSPSLPPQQTSSSLHRGSPYVSPPHSPNLSYRVPMPRQSSLSDPHSNYDDTVSDLGTMNSTSSQASVPRVRRGRMVVPGPEVGSCGVGAEVCSITSDYSTTSSMTFLTGAELPEVQSVAESRGGDDADDERSELISEGRAIETDSESDLSVFTFGKAEPSCQRELQDVPRPLQSHRLIDCDTLSRKKNAQQKTDSESSLDGARSEKDSNKLLCVLEPAKVRSSASLSSSSRSEADKAEPAWKLKITDRLKVRLRTSADDMFGVGSQRSRSPEGRSKKKNIRRRHTMGGQRDFAELSVLGDWPQQVGLGSGSRTELSAVDRLKPKCSSQDFSIGDWIARERHRTSNPEVSLDLSEQQGALCSTNSPNLGASSSSSYFPYRSAEVLNGDALQSKNLSLAATAHPHKLTSSQVVHSRFYQYL